MKKECMNPIMDASEMEQFINENIGLVTNRTMKKFNTWSLEAKCDYIKKRIEWNSSVKEAKENCKLCNQVKKLMIRKKATVDDVNEVIDICHNFIGELKQAELDKIDNEIKRLQELKNSLSI